MSKEEPTYRENALPPGEPEKFPKTFYYANTIELFERLAHYGLYIGLAIYLRKVVGMSDIEVMELYLRRLPRPVQPPEDARFIPVGK